jgi:hypothetical protein
VVEGMKVCSDAVGSSRRVRRQGECPAAGQEVEVSGAAARDDGPRLNDAGSRQSALQHVGTVPLAVGLQPPRRPERYSPGQGVTGGSRGAVINRLGPAAPTRGMRRQQRSRAVRPRGDVEAVHSAGSVRVTGRAERADSTGGLELDTWCSSRQSRIRIAVRE